MISRRPAMVAFYHLRHRTHPEFIAPSREASSGCLGRACSVRLWSPGSTRRQPQRQGPLLSWGEVSADLSHGILIAGRIRVLTAARQLLPDDHVELGAEGWVIHAIPICAPWA